MTDTDTDEPTEGEMRTVAQTLIKRRRLLKAIGGAAVFAGIAESFAGDGNPGQIHGGRMALSQAFNVAGDLWVGPSSARGGVDADSGRIYIESDTGLEYYGDSGTWTRVNPESIDHGVVIDLGTETATLGAVDRPLASDGEVAGKPTIDRTIYLDPTGTDDPDPDTDGTQSNPVSLEGAMSLAPHLSNQVIQFDYATVPTLPVTYDPGHAIHFPHSFGGHSVAEVMHTGDTGTPSNVTVAQAFTWGWGLRGEHGLIEGITFDEGVQLDGTVFVDNCVLNPHTASDRCLATKDATIKVTNSTIGDGTTADVVRCGGPATISFENSTLDGVEPELDGGTGATIAFDTGNTISRFSKAPGALHDDEVRSVMGADTGWVVHLGGGTMRSAQAAADDAGIYRPVIADLTGNEDFGGSVAAQSTATVTINNVTGARTNQNVVMVGPPSNFPSELAASAVVTATDTVELRATNPTTGSVAVTADNWNIAVIDMREPGVGSA